MFYRSIGVFIMIAMTVPSFSQDRDPAKANQVRATTDTNVNRLTGQTSREPRADLMRDTAIKIVVSRGGESGTAGDTLQLSELITKIQKTEGENRILDKQVDALGAPSTLPLKFGTPAQSCGTVLQESPTQGSTNPDSSLLQFANRISQDSSVNSSRRSGSDSKGDNAQPVTSSVTALQLSDVVMEMKKLREENKELARQFDALKAPVTPSIKVGILSQTYGQALQEQTTAAQDTSPSCTQHLQRQLFVRRLRTMFGGEISKNTSFFVESDATNIGKVDATGAKPTKVSMYIQDAYIQQTFIPELSVIAGLQLVGITRNSLQSAASLMALDYGSYQFLTSSPFDNTAGRDVGMNLRGFLLDQRLEYRAGLFSGKNFNLYSPLRTVVRLNYMAEDREKGFFYTGTTLGKGRIFSVGGGLDLQGSYKSYSLDIFGDLPLFGAGSVTASGSWTYLNGGGSDADSTFFTGVIPRQSVVFSEVGYYFKEYDVQPYLKFESDLVNAQVLRQVCATPSTLDLQNKLRSKQRFGVGINYYIHGHNASVKILYELVSRWRNSLAADQVELITTSEATVQMQLFVF